MRTDFHKMTHDEIYRAVQTGVPGAVSGAASQLSDLNTTISGHLDVLDKLSKSMGDAWPDENGQNFRSTLSDTIGYLRELQATHITTASSSVTQVMAASHEKLSSTQSTIPTPPATPVAQQEATLNKESKANGGVMNEGLAIQSQHIAAAKADDARAVALATSLANLYLAEKAKLTAPPAAPTGPSGTGSGSGSAAHGFDSGAGTGSSHFAAGLNSGSPASGSGGTGANGSVGPVTHVPDPGHGGTAGVGTGGVRSGTGSPVGGFDGGVGGHGSDGGVGGGSGSGAGGIPGAGGNPGGPGTLLDPSRLGVGGTGAGAGSPSGLPGSGSDSFGGVVPGMLGGAGVAALGGLGGAGVVAARKAAAVRAAEQAALLKQEEEAGVEGSMGGGANLTASQLAAINAQRNGVLASGEEAGLMAERNYLSTQQRTFGSAALTAEEQAELTAGQGTVAGQLGGSPVAAGSARPAGAPFSAGGVVGGAERVTWLVEDRDLWAVDPGVRSVIEE